MMQSGWYRKQVSIRVLMTTCSIAAIALIAGLIGNKPTAAIAAEGRQSDQLTDFVNSVASELDAYWSGIFQQMGWQYTTPGVSLEGNGQAEATPCDEGAPTVEHSYCPANDTIKLDIDSNDADSFTSDVNDGRDGVVVFTIAHEWGHHLQNLRQSYSANTLMDELQADCLAGVFTAVYYSGQGWQAEIADTIASVREAGSPANPERTHGTAAERAAAFNMGYNAGDFSACGQI
jgi:predicted metalloprotease